MNINRFIVENTASQQLGSAVPPYWLFNPAQKTTLNRGAYSKTENVGEKFPWDEKSEFKNALDQPMVMPLRIRKHTDEETDWWLFPIEPTISITGKNTIVRRNVSKGKIRGSIKERWSQDDYTVKINGVLFDPKRPDIYPKTQVRKLKEYCEHGKLRILWPLNTIVDIDTLVVESFDFPFTNGEGNQAFSITAYSDNAQKLLLEGDDLIYK